MKLDIASLTTTDAKFEQQLAQLLYWDMAGDGAVNQAVRQVLADVRTNGDEAVTKYTAQFDRWACESADQFVLDNAQFENCFNGLPNHQQQALRFAAHRIRDYHEHQLQTDWQFTDELGNRLGQRITPIGRVGLYVPGGQAAYPSTVLMTAIPAQVAGVKSLAMTVPTPNGLKNNLVLAAAYVAGVTEGYAVGGAQAIGALAYGTQSIAKVDKIVGPGGAYVAAAKREVFGTVGIDLIAGPSEILIIADGSAPAAWLAMDIFSQAEHDALAQSILLCPDEDYLQQIHQALVDLLPQQSRRETILTSLNNRGALVRTRSLAEALEVANQVAPEHLQLAVANPEALLDGVTNAGAIFLGAHSPEVMGDYVAGPSHVLPTFGTARFSSPLGVYDFQKRSSVINLSPAGASELAFSAADLARGEGLEAHAQAAEMRKSNQPNPQNKFSK